MKPIDEVSLSNTTTTIKNLVLPFSKTGLILIEFLLLSLLTVTSIYPQVSYFSVPFEKLKKGNTEAIKNVVKTNDDYSLQTTAPELSYTYNIREVKIGGLAEKVFTPKSTNKAFVLMRAQYKILVIDLPTAAVIDSIIFEDYPYDMIINKSGDKIFVTTAIASSDHLIYGYASTYVINTLTNKISRKITVGPTDKISSVLLGPVSQLVLSDDENYLYMFGASRTIYMYDLEFDRLESWIDIPNADYKKSAVISKGKIVSNSIIYTNGVSNFYPIIVDLDSSKVKHLQFQNEGYNFITTSIPIISPDKENIFISYNKPSLKGTLVLDSQTGDLKKVIDGISTESEFVYNSDSSIAYVPKIELSFGYPSYIYTLRTILNLSTLEKTGEINGSGYSGKISNDFKYIYYTKYSAPELGGEINYGTPAKLDLTISDLSLNQSNTITIYDSSISICKYRSVDVSGQYVIVTNSNFNTVSIFTIKILPSTPVLSYPENYSKNLLTPLSLQWAQCTNTDKYHLELSDSVSFGNILIQDSTLTNTSFEIDSLPRGKVFCWRVRAGNQDGWGNWSAVYKFKTKELVLPSVPKLSLPANNAANVLAPLALQWEASTTTTRYHLELSDSVSFENILIQDSLLTKTSFEIDSLPRGKEYFWRVRAGNEDGWSSWSGSYKFTIQVVSDVKEKAIPAKYEVFQNYPNPFNPSTRIGYSVPEPGNVKIVICDLLGREIVTLVDEDKSAGNYSVEFNASQLSGGIYFYQMKAKGFLQTKKMLLLK